MPDEPCMSIGDVDPSMVDAASRSDPKVDHFVARSRQSEGLTTIDTLVQQSQIDPSRELYRTSSAQQLLGFRLL